MNIPVEKRYNRIKVKRHRKDFHERSWRNLESKGAEEPIQDSQEKQPNKSVSQYTKVVREFGERRENIESKAVTGKASRPNTVTKGRLTVGARGLFMRSKVSSAVTRGSPLNEMNKARMDEDLFRIIHLANPDSDRSIAQPSHSNQQMSPLHIYQDVVSPKVDDPPTPHDYANPAKRARNRARKSTAAHASGNDRFSPKLPSTERRSMPRGRPRAKENRHVGQRTAGSMSRQPLGLSSGSSSGGGYVTSGSGQGDQHNTNATQIGSEVVGSYEHFAALMAETLENIYLKQGRKTTNLLTAKLKLQGFYKSTLKLQSSNQKLTAEVKAAVDVGSSDKCRTPLLPIPNAAAIGGASNSVRPSVFYSNNRIHNLPFTATSIVVPNHPPPNPARPDTIPINQYQLNENNFGPPNYFTASSSTGYQQTHGGADIQGRFTDVVPNVYPPMYLGVDNRPTISSHEYQQPQAFPPPFDYHPQAFTDVGNQFRGADFEYHPDVVYHADAEYYPDVEYRSNIVYRPDVQYNGEYGPDDVDDTDKDSFTFSPYVAPEAVYADPLQFLPKSNGNAMCDQDGNAPRGMNGQANGHTMRETNGRAMHDRQQESPFCDRGYDDERHYAYGSRPSDERGRVGNGRRQVPSTHNVAQERGRSGNWYHAANCAAVAAQYEDSNLEGFYCGAGDLRYGAGVEPRGEVPPAGWQRRAPDRRDRNQQLRFADSDLGQARRNADEWGYRQHHDNDFYLSHLEDSAPRVPCPEDSGMGTSSGSRPPGLKPWESITPVRKFYRHRLY